MHPQYPKPFSPEYLLKPAPLFLAIEHTNIVAVLVDFSKIILGYPERFGRRDPHPQAYWYANLASDSEELKMLLDKKIRFYLVMHWLLKESISFLLDPSEI